MLYNAYEVLKLLIKPAPFCEFVEMLYNAYEVLKLLNESPLKSPALVEMLYNAYEVLKRYTSSSKNLNSKLKCCIMPMRY